MRDCTRWLQGRRARPHHGPRWTIDTRRLRPSAARRGEAGRRPSGELSRQCSWHVQSHCTLPGRELDLARAAAAFRPRLPVAAPHPHHISASPVEPRRRTARIVVRSARAASQIRIWRKLCRTSGETRPTQEAKDNALGTHVYWASFGSPPIAAPTGVASGRTCARTKARIPLPDENGFSARTNLWLSPLLEKLIFPIFGKSRWPHLWGYRI